MLQAMTTMESGIMLWVQEYLRKDWLDPFWIAVTTLGNGGMIWISDLCGNSDRTFRSVFFK